MTFIRFKLPYRQLFSIFLLIPALMAVGCWKPSNKIDIEAHKKEIEQWKERRLTRLTSETGWLTLCGLFWLKEGKNNFGSDSSNEIILPLRKAPKVAGSLWLEKGAVRFQARPKVEIRYKDSVVTSLVVRSDEDGSGDPTILTIGTLSFYVIKRGGQLGVRVKDKENPARLHFAGLEYFPADPKRRFEARFEPYNPPKTIPIINVFGMESPEVCPGSLVFYLDGKTYRIDAIRERGAENQLFIIFKDETNGKETYNLGRQLYTSLPDNNNMTILDFNKAYNFPCAFTEFTTCPIPPKQNHLPFRVEAGEKKYSGAKS